MVRRGETKSDTAGFLGCSCQAVSMAVINGYKVPDNLDEDADYLCGKLGELVDVDELNDGGTQLKQEISSDYELTSDAMFVDDGDVGSDSGGEFNDNGQPQERQSARLRGIKAPFVRMSVSPTSQARQKPARTRSQSAQSQPVVEVSSEDEDENGDEEARPSTVATPAKFEQPKKKPRYDEHTGNPVQRHMEYTQIPKQFPITGAYFGLRYFYE
ncbi:hypothetical protein EWM64_g8696 [Hericium alpestre]|uniref:Uncharacterized protein n=1 Tax=Hericium alpestre TaxID=135208 RepID=A0A4Y9ZKI1_9AGAM|nr:hypothetical protein EWM64_g8696 [Hericium alpestre]